MEKVVVHKGEKLRVVKHQYGNGVIALELVTEDGERWCTASINIPEAADRLKANETFIKDWSENEGILKALQDAKVVGPVLFEVSTGFVTAKAVTVF